MKKVLIFVLATLVLLAMSVGAVNAAEPDDVEAKGKVVSARSIAGLPDVYEGVEPNSKWKVEVSPGGQVEAKFDFTCDVGDVEIRSVGDPIASETNYGIYGGPGVLCVRFDGVAGWLEVTLGRVPFGTYGAKILVNTNDGSMSLNLWSFGDNPDLLGTANKVELKY